MAMYDYLVVGAGLFGAMCARELADAGKKVLVVEKRGHVAGNAYTEKAEECHFRRAARRVKYYDMDQVIGAALEKARELTE